MKLKRHQPSTRIHGCDLDLDLEKRLEKNFIRALEIWAVTIYLMIMELFF